MNAIVREVQTTKIQRLTDQELDASVKSLVVKERRITQEILWHIAEIDSRKLFLGMAYASLFEYLTAHLGYSEGSAQRRIDAARLIAIIPTVAVGIERGELNLSQISKLQRICRQVRKDTGDVVSIAKQKAALDKLKLKNAKQTDLYLAQEFQTSIVLESRSQIQRDESVRVEITFRKEEMEIIDQAQSLLSNKTGGSLKAAVLEMAARTVRSFAPGKMGMSCGYVSCGSDDVGMEIPSSSGSKTADKNLHDQAVTATVAVEGGARVNDTMKLTAKIKKQIRKRDGSCQFRDFKTGKTCGSTFFLEVDHICPKFLGGPNTPQNLRMLCKNHNQFRCREGLIS